MEEAVTRGYIHKVTFWTSALGIILLMAHEHIERLKKQAVLKEKEIAGLRADIKKYRAENPEVAAVYDENELLKSVLQEAQAKLDRLNTTVAGAVLKALANPSSSGDSAGANPLPIGASDWRPDFGAALEKAKTEPDRIAVVKETVRLAKGGPGDLEVERARQFRKAREARTGKE